MRVAAVLNAHPRLTLRAAASVAEVLEAEAPDGLLVWCHDAVRAEEVAILKRIGTALPDVRVVVVCESTDARDARRALDAGADGFVTKDGVAAALVPTVEAVLAGQIVVPRRLPSCLSPPVLSMREKQVLGMVVMGFTNGEIATRLFLAESTIKSHLSSAYTKLGARSRNEAATMILDPHGSLGTGILTITPDEPTPGDAAEDVRWLRRGT